MILNNNLTWNYKCFFSKFAAFSISLMGRLFYTFSNYYYYLKLNVEVIVRILSALKNILKKFIKQCYLHTEIDIYN
jgi:predicted NAD-dependent protein-ADP-ribosyltransferase YbiA (DUF1768 family)